MREAEINNLLSSVKIKKINREWKFEEYISWRNLENGRGDTLLRWYGQPKHIKDVMFVKIYIITAEGTKKRWITKDTDRHSEWTVKD